MEELDDGDEQDAQSEEWLEHVLDDVLLVSVEEDGDSKDEGLTPELVNGCLILKRQEEVQFLPLVSHCADQPETQRE